MVNLWPFGLCLPGSSVNQVLRQEYWVNAISLLRNFPTQSWTEFPLSPALEVYSLFIRWVIREALLMLICIVWASLIEMSKLFTHFLKIGLLFLVSFRNLKNIYSEYKLLVRYMIFKHFLPFVTCLLAMCFTNKRLINNKV